jgi:DNA-binding Xre family transcriptional regulator
MLKFNFQRILKARGVEKTYTYLVQEGFSRNVAVRMNTGKLKSISLKELEKLCVKFNCTPNDLLEWVPDRYAGDIDMHPLRELKRVDTSANIKALLSAIPISKLEEIESYIKGQVKS